MNQDDHTRNTTLPDGLVIVWSAGGSGCTYSVISLQYMYVVYIGGIHERVSGLLFFI